jgi:hypothetical protein
LTVPLDWRKSGDIPQPDFGLTSKSSKLRMRARLRVGRIVQEDTHKTEVLSLGMNPLPAAGETLPKTCLPVSAPECALIKLDSFVNLPSDLNRSGQILRILPKVCFSTHLQTGLRASLRKMLACASRTYTSLFSAVCLL